MKKGLGRRGFIFSIDAMFAISLVVILGGLFMAYYAAQEPSSHAMETLETKAMDRAIVDLYLYNNTDTDEPPQSVEVDYHCAYLFYFDVIQIHNPHPYVTKKCEGMITYG